MNEAEILPMHWLWLFMTLRHYVIVAEYGV